MSAFVLAVVGESPAVLTELLWWLEVKEACGVAGIEVWTTDQGAKRLRALVGGPVWRALQNAARIRLPELQSSGEPSPFFDMRIHVWDQAGRPLNDVRSPGEVNAVSAILNARVKDLCKTLPESVRLVGSLAGGRKTVSAALQTAFSLQSRHIDRLVHVVLNEELERQLRADGLINDFAYPTRVWETRTGVAVESQVEVYTVPYPRLRELGFPKLQAILDKPWEEVWPALERCRDQRIVGLLFPERRSQSGVSSRIRRVKWTYRLADQDTGQSVNEVSLSWALGWTLAGIASLGEATQESLQAWLEEQDGWIPTGVTQQARDRSIRANVHKLRQRLCFPPQWSAFALPDVGYRLRGVTVLAGPPEDGEA